MFLLVESNLQLHLGNQVINILASGEWLRTSVTEYILEYLVFILYIAYPINENSWCGKEYNSREDIIFLKCIFRLSIIHSRSKALQ